ncbi:HNH endonuclease [Bacillus sp. 0102A]|uniref:HNH endonuclease n=1 Tax=Bacillus sp. 0102A TaxID=3120563 RepID=UPI002FDB8724
MLTFKKVETSIYKLIGEDPSLIKNLDLTEIDLLDLQNGITLEKYTWHHHQTPGKMELVDRSYSC